MATDMKKINIIIVDDHTLVRQTLGFVLSRQTRFNVVGECGNGEEIAKLSEQLKPDVILLDVGLPESNGIKIVSAIKQIAPGSKVIVMSQYSYTDYVRKLMQAGALGYITKRSTLQEIQDAILSVQEGKKYICSEIRDRLADEWIDNAKRPVDLDLLTSREKEIIMFIQKGCSSKEIAVTLHLSLKTIEVYRYKILKKLKVKNFMALMHLIKVKGAETDLFLQ
jgi:DNA-binding NarL/FixJ family response regulator